MAESASGQGEANPVFWLAIGAGKIGSSCWSILRWSCKKNFSFWLFHKSFIDQVCFIKVAECWPVLFCVFLLSGFSGKILVFWIGGRTWRLIRPYLMLFGVLITYVLLPLAMELCTVPIPSPAEGRRWCTATVKSFWIIQLFYPHLGTANATVILWWRFVFRFQLWRPWAVNWFER